MNENEKSSTPSASPGFSAETVRLPEQGSAAAGSPAPPAADGTTGTRQPVPDDRPKAGKRWLLIGAAVVALLAVGGGAYAIGANAGDDDGRPAAHGQQGTGRDDDADPDDGPAGEVLRDGTDAPDGVDDDRNENPGNGNDASRGSGTGTHLPASDAGALRDAAEAAIAETGAKGATSIDVQRGGYEVEVQLADGSQPDVFIAVDGSVTVGTDRPDADDRPDPLLDLGQLAGISKAALAASARAGGADGAIDAISTTDDPGSAYEVSVRLPDGRDASVDLSADLTAVATDIDDD